MMECGEEDIHWIPHRGTGEALTVCPSDPTSRAIGHIISIVGMERSEAGRKTAEKSGDKENRV
jgi:hypothetical protein